jgi:hypothetical protein
VEAGEVVVEIRPSPCSHQSLVFAQWKLLHSLSDTLPQLGAVVKEQFMLLRWMCDFQLLMSPAQDTRTVEGFPKF